MKLGQKRFGAILILVGALATFGVLAASKPEPFASLTNTDRAAAAAGAGPPSRGRRSTSLLAAASAESGLPRSGDSRTVAVERGLRVRAPSPMSARNVAVESGRTAAPSAEWFRGVRRAKLLAWASLGWMTIEGVAAVFAGIMAGSIALIG